MMNWGPNIPNSDSLLTFLLPLFGQGFLKNYFYKNVAQPFSFWYNDKKIIRTMPNTPALVNCGMTSLSPNKNLDKNDIEAVKNNHGNPTDHSSLIVHNS